MNPYQCPVPSVPHISLQCAFPCCCGDAFVGAVLARAPGVHTAHCVFMDSAHVISGAGAHVLPHILHSSGAVQMMWARVHHALLATLAMAMRHAPLLRTSRVKCASTSPPNVPTDIPAALFTPTRLVLQRFVALHELFHRASTASGGSPTVIARASTSLGTSTSSIVQQASAGALSGLVLQPPL